MAKKYSINWENDEPASFEVDGVKYDSLDDIPNWKDKDKLAAMVHAASEDDFEEVKFDEKEFEEIQKAAADPTMERWVLGGFTGIAVVMILIAVIASFLNIQKIAKEETAPARVLEVVKNRQYINERDGSYNDYYYPVVQFTASDGKTRKVQLSEANSSPTYEAGEEVTVRYDPEHPLDARIKSIASNMLMWVLPVITGILGIAFAGAVFVVRKVMSA